MKTARGCLPKILSLIFLTSILSGQGLPVFGDGTVFVWRNEKADIFQPTQKAVIYWDGREEKLILETKYEGPAEEMVWVVPVPSEPTVKKGDPEIFEEMSRRTQEPDISYARFRMFQWAGVSGSPSPLEWQRRIGAYDVAVLSPVGATQVVAWLKANDYGVPNEAVPILEDYIERKWWMVASRIHRDALNRVTRGQLAKGTLHPLEMTFKTTRCIYPLRLTSLAAGPVEVLLYIEGPDHYKPTTLVGPQWQMNLYGGPRRRVPMERYRRMPDWERAQAIAKGKTELVSETCLTKLRRTFWPKEMTDDIEFGQTDYAKFVASGHPRSVAEAATQYGRHRDPEGTPQLLEVLSGAPLTDDNHIRCAVWALGEISIESDDKQTIEKALLRCAERGPSIIRMEAYIALEKAGSERLGEQLVKSLAAITGGNTEVFPSGSGWWKYEPELDLMTQWLDARATGNVKNDYVRTVCALLVQAKRRIDELIGTEERIRADSLIDEPQEWVIQRATVLQDAGLIEPLAAIRGALPDKLDGRADKEEIARMKLAVLAAEAACGADDYEHNYRMLMAALGEARLTNLLLSLFEKAETPWKQDAIFSGLLWTGSERVLPVLEKMVREVWCDRFESAAGSVERAADRVDLFLLHREPYAHRARAFFLEFLRDESVDAEYRAYIAARAPAEFGPVLLPAVKSLLEYDMPDSLRDRLENEVNKIEEQLKRQKRQSIEVERLQEKLQGNGEPAFS